MKVFITGGRGFVGTHLSRLLLARGHEVTGASTSSQARLQHPNYRYVAADLTRKGSWQDLLGDADAAINLAGRSIFGYWTKAYKQEMYDSRILTTRNLVEAIPRGRDFTLFSTSAVGYYGDGGEAILTEASGAGDDFLAALSRDWEAEAARAGETGARVVITRFGIVLGPDGGAMQKMIPAFRFFLGGPLGDGRQWFPWIHLEDLLEAFGFLMENPSLAGVFNFCAPHPVRNREFANTLGEVLGRPAVMPAPAFMIRLVLGEFGDALLNSQRAHPERLLQSGFSFRYPDLGAALAAIVQAKT